MAPASPARHLEAMQDGMDAPSPTPAHADLADRDGLIRLDRRFLAALAAEDAGLHAHLLAARAAPDALDPKDEAELLLALGPHLEGFVARLFGIEAEVAAIAARTHALDPIHACKRLFVQRQAVKTYPDPSGFDGAALARRDRGSGSPPRSPSSASRARSSSGRPTPQRSTSRCAMPPGRRSPRPAAPRIAGGTLFRVPHRIDPQHLVPVETIERDGVTMLRLPPRHWRARDGFSLTDPGMTEQQALDQMNYCIWCHHQGEGFLLARDCATARPARSRNRRSASRWPAARWRSASREMHELRARRLCSGRVRDHRDRQPDDGGDRPSHLQRLHEGLHLPEAGAGRYPAGRDRDLARTCSALPWGFEIYALLTRWNPLDIRRPLPRPP